MPVATKVRHAGNPPLATRNVRSIVACEMNVVVHVPNYRSPIARIVQQVIGVTVIVKVKLTSTAGGRRRWDCRLQPIYRNPLLTVEVSAGDLVCPKVLSCVGVSRQWQLRYLLSACQGIFTKNNRASTPDR